VARAGNGITRPVLLCARISAEVALAEAPDLCADRERVLDILAAGELGKIDSSDFFKPASPVPPR
jgi:hypothetical protein